MTKETKESIKQELLDSSNDIMEYLNTGVPLECYVEDIDWKLAKTRKRVEDLLSNIPD
jgi:hypothetical protein